MARSSSTDARCNSGRGRAYHVHGSLRPPPNDTSERREIDRRDIPLVYPKLVLTPTIRAVTETDAELEVTESVSLPQPARLLGLWSRAATDLTVAAIVTTETIHTTIAQLSCDRVCSDFQ